MPFSEEKSEVIMNLKTMLKKLKNTSILRSVISYTKENKIKVKIILLVVICGAMIIRGIMQQPEIIENKNEISNLNEEIEYEKIRQEEVEDMRENVDTDEYIERIARDKLGMIKENERIFVDVSTTD